MAPPRYKDVEDCRREIQQYIRHLDGATDDNDPNMRDSGSTRRYKQDLRWFDHWLDDHGIESVMEVSVADASELGTDLSAEFNGTTPLYRWDRLHAFYEWMVRMEIAEKNPLDRWDADKQSRFGMSKTTEQSKHLKDGESYAVTQDDVRAMEEHVGRPKNRNVLLIRLLWQTGIRRGEAAELRVDDIDRNTREVKIRASVAKNDQKRVVAYQPSLDGLMTTWLDKGHRDSYNSRDLPYLFIGERGAQMRGEAINDVVKKAAINAGINRKLDYEDANTGERWLISAHSVRHGYASHLINNVRPETNGRLGIWEVSKQLGHSSVDITEAIYVEHDPEAGLEQIKQYGPE